MKTTLLFLSVFLSTSLFGQNVFIPDANFKAYLVGNSEINTNGDTEIQVSEASAFTGEISCIGQSISDLTGIEAFNALTQLILAYNPLTSLNVSGCAALIELQCPYSQLTSLDVSGCTNLTTFYCYNNQLTSLDVSGCAALTQLSCGSNPLASLDVNPALIELFIAETPITSLNVSACVDLTKLYCNDNQLTSLDVSNNPALIELYCNDNQLTSLDVSNNPALIELVCDDNQLTSLDVSNNPALIKLVCYDNFQLSSLNVFNNAALTYLECFNNQLTSLDVSGCAALTELSCSNNQLTSLGVSGCAALTELSCSNNQLTSLDLSNYTALTYVSIAFNQLECLNVKNGNNTGLFLAANQNPNLTCIEVDDVNYSTNNWNDWVDPQTSFSTDCGTDCLPCIPNSSIDSHTVCESFTWLDGNTYTSSNNTATYVTINAEGCDSIITLNLTINNSSSSNDLITSCNSYTWIDGNTYTTSNNSATYTTSNAAGCDSTVNLDLTINPTPDNSITQNGGSLTATQTGATYQWIDCDNFNAPITGEVNQIFSPSSTGNYAVEVTVGDCSSISECILIDFTGIDEIESLISVHPNPTKDEVTLSVGEELLGTEFFVTDNAGRIILTDTFKSTEQNINLSVFDNGVYIIRTDKESPVKIIKQ